MGSSNGIEASFRDEANWQEDSCRPGCFHCNATFSLTNRRHHCRCCGEIFCQKCWGKRAPLPMDLFPLTERLIQRQERTMSRAQQEELRKRSKEAQGVCDVCFDVVASEGRMVLLCRGVDLKLVRIGLKPLPVDSPKRRPSTSREKEEERDGVEAEGQQQQRHEGENKPQEAHAGLARDSITESDCGSPMSLDGAPVDQRVNLRSTQDKVHWSTVSSQVLRVQVGSWRPYTKGTHLRFTVPGASSSFSALSLPSFGADQSHSGNVSFSFDGSGAPTMDELPANSSPEMDSTPQGSDRNLTPPAESQTRFPSALKARGRKDRRDLELPRAKSADHFSLDTLPPTWRIGCRSVTNCAVGKGVDEHAEEHDTLLQIETSSQILLFTPARPQEVLGGRSCENQLRELSDAISAAVSVSRTRARLHIAVGDSSQHHNKHYHRRATGLSADHFHSSQPRNNQIYQ